MKLNNEQVLSIKNKVFGGGKTLVCLPLVSKDRESLVEEAKELMTLDPDVIEWRVDFFNSYGDVLAIVEALKALNEVINKIPLIFTPRHVQEGGFKEITQENRLEIIEKTLITGFVDILDIELMNDAEFISKVKEMVVKYNSKLILSHHNFKKTPEEDFIYNKLIEEKEAGADIPKIAVMPENEGDVLKLMNATYKAKVELNMPLITMSMGELGKVTRAIGGLYGSDMTFAVGKEASAPGQIPIKDLETIFSIL